MFHVERVTGRSKLSFGLGSRLAPNTVTVVTGANGSGKTELLRSLARTFVNPRSTSGTQVSWLLDGKTYRSTDAGALEKAGPARVIAQTFSPFTRFDAPPEEERPTISRIYGEGLEAGQQYRVLGLHRRSKYIGGLLSKRVLEQGLFGWSESPEQTYPLGNVLSALGFESQVRMVYRIAPGMRDLLRAFDRRELPLFLEKYLPGGAALSARPTLAREIEQVGLAAVADLLSEAIRLLRPRLDRAVVEFQFSFTHARASEDFAILQGLALLRRLKILRLANCLLKLSLNGEFLDLAHASSGQQQLLCTMFGLVSELRANSLVLIDEPELSLHPSWQMSFIGWLDAILRQFKGCHVFIATHSPLIVQAALQSQLEVIRLASDFTGHSDALAPKLQRASVEGALVDVFNTPVSSSTYLANEIVRIVRAGEGGEQIERAASIDRLQRLRRTYTQGAVVHDERTVNLIEDALKLVSTPDDPETSESFNDS